MEIGQRVMMTTSAGSRSINKFGKLVGGGDGWRKPAIIVAVGCVLPTYDNGAYVPNNTIIQVCETKQLIFTHINRLEPFEEITIRYFCDGEDVTDKISDLTKRNLTRG